MLSKILIYKNFLIRFLILNISVFGCIFPISAEAVSESLRKTVVEGISGEGPTTGWILVMGGILASLLPCVYPLYPITVGIVRARGEGSPKILHPAIYYLGLVATYSCFGLIAGFSGGAFNVILRYPIVNLGLSILIFYWHWDHWI